MSDIKSQVEECLKQAEEIERAGVIKDKLNTTFRENLRYEFLKFLVYLSDGDGYVDEKEIAFINSTLGYRMTEGQIKSIMFYDKLHDDSYTRKVPFALKGFVLCDAGRKLNDDKKRANNLVNTFRALGQEFVACNDVTSEREVNMLTDYLAVMEKFLKEYGLYDSKLSVKARKAEKRSVDEVLEELNQLVGLDGVKQEVNSLVNLLRIQKLREEKGMKQPNVSKHLVFSGNPGTGKTTTASIVAKESNMDKSVHMHTDDFFHYLSKGAIPPHLPESNEQNLVVIEAFLEAAKRYARGGYDVIVDGIVGPWFLEPWRALVREDYEVHYIVLRASKEETMKRAVERSKLDRKTNVELVETMWEQFSGLGVYESNVIDTTTFTIKDTVSAIKERVACGTSLLS